MYYIKKSRFGYTNYNGEIDDDTLIVINRKEYDKLDEKVIEFQDEIETLSDELEELNAEVERNKNVRNERDELYKESNNLKKEIKEVKSDRDKYVGRSEYFSKILRERSNSERKITPKKKHTGYVYVSTQPIVYRYEKEGRIYSEILLKTKFQTPYQIGIDFKYVNAQCLDDFTFDRINKKGYASLLGLQTGFYLEKFEDIEKYIRKKISEQCKGDFSKPKEITKAINDMNIICNPQMIRNGLSGYWEFLFFHKFHLSSIPDSMSIRHKKNKQATETSEIDEENSKKSNEEIEIIEDVED